MTGSDVRVRLGAERVTRAFGPVVANRELSLAVAPGTVHAIVGENGAGKSTLMRILYGLERPDSGTVIVDDVPVVLDGPRRALELGIGMVQQELATIPDLTLLENLVIGAEPRRGPAIDWASARRRALEFAERVGVDVDWDARAAVTPVNVRQQLEVLRLMHRGADVLILDEPTAVLAPPQVAELFSLLRDLRDDGRTILFISHKLEEVLEIADAITVIRAGSAVATHRPEETSRDELIEAIVGSTLAATDAPHPEVVPGPAVLEVRQLSASDDRGIARLQDVDLTVRAGEIVGVAGVSGNGQDELVESIVGLRNPVSGTILLDDIDVSTTSVRARRERGIAYISADRRSEGLAVMASLVPNSLLGHHRDPARSRRGVLRRDLAATVRDLLGRFGVRFGSVTDPASSLSGGNQQRVVLARELDAGPRVVVAAQPTRGVDVRGIAFVHGRLEELRQRGAGVLLVSEELTELLQLSDRIVVLAGGRVAGVVGRDEATRTVLGRLMTGVAA